MVPPKERMWREEAARGAAASAGWSLLSLSLGPVDADVELFEELLLFCETFYESLHWFFCVSPFLPACSVC